MTANLIRNRIAILACTLAGAAFARAQNTVTTPGGTPNTIPAFTASATIGNSPIAVSAGFVGIGNTSPAFTLDVSGDINLSGSAFRYTGYPVIQAQPSIGNYFFAGSGNSTGSGYNNVGLGSQALSSNTTGIFNVAIGTASLKSNTTGAWNMALGAVALLNNTTGIYNSAVGPASLTANTSGSFNSAVGMGALEVNTTGYNNTAVGQDSLPNNTIGHDNSTIGVGSLATLTTGNANDVLGSNALTGIQTGIDNVAIGDGAGDDAGGAPNTSATQNTYLGASTQSLLSGDINEIVIGAYATGNGSNSVTLGNTNVTSTILRGNVTLTPGGSGASITFPGYSVPQSTPWIGVLNGQDYAETVDIAGTKDAYEPGDLMIIDADGSRKFEKSRAPYSTLVAGIYSTKPGILGKLRANAPDKDTQIPLAIVGIVPTKVTAENGPIKPGDLLVTSSTPGTAMKGTDPSRMLGAVIGKSLGSLSTGAGVIEVLVTLQ